MQDQTLPIHSQQKQPCFGYTLLSVMHLVCGQNIRLPPKHLKISTFWRVVHFLYSSIINLAVIFCVGTTILTFLKYRENFGHALFIASSFFGVLECFIRITYTTICGKKIENVAARVYETLEFTEVDAKRQKTFIVKMSRIITILVTVLFSAFIVSISANYFSTFGQLEDIFGNVNGTEEEINQQMMSKQVPLEVVEAWTYVCAFFQLWPSTGMLKVYAAFLHVINFLGIGRIIVSDILFYSWYAIIINRYHMLAKSAPAVLNKQENDKRLVDWIQFHHTINELLQEVNELSSPGIVAAVVCTSLQICILSYVVIKMHDKAIIWSFLMFGIGSIYQVFVYCLLGQWIKDKVMELHSEVYRGPWIENEFTKQHAAVIICSAASEKIGQCLPGAPFFSMSLQFFASMTSVVFTYIMVLIQLN
ncbi:uncharacterized protein LOC135938682 [Cloeon dipterum]|uniref:uncharacterized protein LOC135938682 n=1 Tax=Cloeon dipterum TaxID=197152 RepID=UPI0032209C23